MAAAVKNALKESLVGTIVSEPDSELSAHTKANFEKYARKDEFGECYMMEEEFVNAIVPRDENFVGFPVWLGCACICKVSVD
jgi:solute carrier family 25 aspartate/glutamate transporter 12/13